MNLPTLDMGYEWNQVISHFVTGLFKLHNELMAHSSSKVIITTQKQNYIIMYIKFELVSRDTLDFDC